VKARRGTYQAREGRFLAQQTFHNIRRTNMSDQLIPQGDGDTFDEGGDINEGLSNQPINDPDD
jgi:hypothetical protein